MDAGHRIRELREKKNIKQGELAEIVGLSGKALSAVENGRNNPTAELLIKLSDFFGVSTDYLLTGKEEAATISPIEQEIIQAVRHDSELLNSFKEVIELKKKVMSQIKRLSQRSLEEQHLEHA